LGLASRNVIDFQIPRSFGQDMIRIYGPIWRSEIDVFVIRI